MNGRGRSGGGFMGRGGYGGRSNGGGGGGGRGAGRYTNPCLTMHQPWASLLVYGIKRIEGRSWPAPITGRLWIHAASKVPEEETIRAMEDFYTEIYAVDGIKDIKFPEHYPVSHLLGCVEVVGCLKVEELVSWGDVPESVRLEGLTDFCWLCENPQRLPIPFEMRGNQGVYNMEKRIHDAAVRGLIRVQGPLPVQFPLPNPSDRFSIRPGCLSLKASSTGAVVRSDKVNAAIAGAKAAATQFSRSSHSMAVSADHVSEESACTAPPRGGSGASTAGEHVEKERALKNDKSVHSTKVDVSTATKGSQAAPAHFTSTSHVDPTGGLRNDGRDAGVGPSRGWSGASIVAERPERELSLKNDKSRYTSKVEVTARIEGLQITAVRTSRSTHLTGGFRTEGRGAGAGSSRGGSGVSIVDEHAERELSTAHSSRGSHAMDPTGVSTEGQGGQRRPNARFGGTNKLLAAALRDIKSNKIS